MNKIAMVHTTMPKNIKAAKIDLITPLDFLRTKFTGYPYIKHLRAHFQSVQLPDTAAINHFRLEII